MFVSNANASKSTFGLTDVKKSNDDERQVLIDSWNQAIDFIRICFIRFSCMLSPFSMSI